jgi:protein-tyrosine phosphatase
MPERTRLGMRQTGHLLDVVSAGGHRSMRRHHVTHVIDLHCHLLPGIDDGPATMDDALALADALAAAGVERVVATPHVSPEYPNGAEVVDKLTMLVASELARRGHPLQVEAGAELDLSHIASLADGELERLHLGDSSVLLVECPFTRVMPHFEGLVRQLMARGNRVLLAHPERSPLFLRDPALLGRLTADGAYASLTGASFTGRFGSTAQRYAEWAVDEGLAHDVASDAHNTKGRPPILRDALENAGYGWAADWLTHDVPQALLRGEALPARPARPARLLPWARKKRAAPRSA